MRNYNSFNIGYQLNGLNKEATEESKAIIKETYRALKKRNKFFNFQLSFNPMEGHVLKSWMRDMKTEDDVVIKLIKTIPIIEFCGLLFRPEHGYEHKAVLNVPIIRKLTILRSMLSCRYSDISRRHKLSVDDVLSIYCEDYFEEYKKTHKPVINELTFSWYVAIAITCLFYCTMIWILSVISPELAFTVLSIHGSVAVSFLFYFIFKKF